MVKKFLFLLPLLILLAGCSAQPKTEENDPKQNVSTESPQVSNISSTDDLMKQLRSAGATVETGGPIQQPFFSVEGKTIKINGQDVQIFQYVDENARQAESNKISKDGSSIGTNMVNWMEPPHFWVTGKIIVLYVGKNQEVIDMMSKIVGPTINQPK